MDRLQDLYKQLAPAEMASDSVTAEAKEKYYKYQIDRKRAYKKLFSTKEGKLILEDLCDIACVWNSTYRQDKRLSERLEGARDLVLEMIKTAGKDPLTIAQEGNKRIENIRNGRDINNANPIK
jgi:hypothetical protein